MVGHNCFCDLLFLFQHFDGPLPSQLLEFKKNYNKTFVNIYDTKLIMNSEPMHAKLGKYKTLQEMYNSLRSMEQDEFKFPVIKPK